MHTPEGKKPYVVPRELADAELPGIVEGFRQAACNAMAAGHVDAVAFGNAFPANPDLPERIRRGAPPAATRPGH